MSLSVIILGGVTLFIGIYLALIPVLTEQQERRRNQAADLPELRQRFGQLLDSVRDLDFDYDMGKLSYDVYAEQRKMLIGRSVSLLIQLDKAESQLVVVDDEIEAAIAEYRQRIA